MIGESDGAKGGAHSLRGKQVFDADRNPVQRAQSFSRHHRPLGRLGRFSRLFGRDGHETIELGLKAIHGRENRVDVLHRRQFLTPNERGRLRGGHEEQLGVGHRRRLVRES